MPCRRSQRALVEAVLRAARGADDRERADDRRPAAARGRAAARAGPARRRRALEAAGARRAAAGEAAAARARPVTTDDEPPGAADVGAQGAAVERVEPRASPPPREHEHEHAAAGSGRRAAGRRARRAAAAARADERGRRRRCGARVREREPGDGRADDDVRGQQPAHGTTSPFRSAIRAGPMPGIASSASTDVNGPCCLAVGDDLLRGHRADAGQRVELLGGRRAERDRAAGSAGTCRGRGAAGRAARGDEHLLAVGDGAARLTAVRSARRVSPPARATASATREPCGRW